MFVAFKSCAVILAGRHAHIDGVPVCCNSRGQCNYKENSHSEAAWCCQHTDYWGTCTHPRHNTVPLKLVATDQEMLELYEKTIPKTWFKPIIVTEMPQFTKLIISPYTP